MNLRWMCLTCQHAPLILIIENPSCSTWDLLHQTNQSYNNTRNGFLLKSRFRLFQSMHLVKTFLLFLYFYKKVGIVGLFQEKVGKSRKRRARLKEEINFRKLWLKQSETVLADLTVVTPRPLTQWPLNQLGYSATRMDLWTKFEEGRSRRCWVIDQKWKEKVTDGPDLLTDRPPNMCKAKCPLFFEGGHNNAWQELPLLPYIYCHF